MSLTVNTGINDDTIWNLITESAKSDTAINFKDTIMRNVYDSVSLQELEDAFKEGDDILESLTENGLTENDFMNRIDKILPVAEIDDIYFSDKKWNEDYRDINVTFNIDTDRIISSLAEQKKHERGTYYVSFGSDHQKQLWGEELADWTILEIKDVTYQEAKDKAFELCGVSWSFVYSEKEFLDSKTKNSTKYLIEANRYTVMLSECNVVSFIGKEQLGKMKNISPTIIDYDKQHTSLFLNNEETNVMDWILGEIMMWEPESGIVYCIRDNGKTIIELENNHSEHSYCTYDQTGIRFRNSGFKDGMKKIAEEINEVGFCKKDLVRCIRDSEGAFDEDKTWNMVENLLKKYTGSIERDYDIDEEYDLDEGVHYE